MNRTYSQREAGALSSCATAAGEKGSEAEVGFPPIADISALRDVIAVRCFRVLLHGQFDRLVQLGPADLDARGFYATRWVVAEAEQDAIRKAIRSTNAELQHWANVRDKFVRVELEAQDVSAGSWWRWLRGGGKGFAFYAED